MNRRHFILASGTAALAAMPLSRAAACPRPLRIAQIGTEHMHAPRKWTTLHRFSDIAVAGIREPSASRRSAAEKREEYRGARWLTESELFGDRALDAVVVETELPDILAVVERCIESGFHVHMDKPPGRDLARFVALENLAAARGRVLQVGYMYRYHPAFQFAFEAAHKGWLGKVCGVHGDIGSDIEPARRAWLAEAYGGSMLLLGCHLVDLTIAVLGAPQAVSVHRRRSGRDNYYDNELAVLNYPDALATVRSFNAEVEAMKRRQWAVFGDRGTVEVLPLEPAEVRLSLREPVGGFSSGSQNVKLPTIPGRYDELLTDFVRMVRGEASRFPKFNPAHERLVHEWVLKCASIG
jgi:predicted dehydrogenase